MQSLKVTGKMVKEKDEEDLFYTKITQFKSTKVISMTIWKKVRVPITGIKRNIILATGKMMSAKALVHTNG